VIKIYFQPISQTRILVMRSILPLCGPEIPSAQVSLHPTRANTLRNLDCSAHILNDENDNAHNNTFGSWNRILFRALLKIVNIFQLQNTCHALVPSLHGMVPFESI